MPRLVFLDMLTQWFEFPFWHGVASWAVAAQTGLPNSALSAFSTGNLKAAGKNLYDSATLKSKAKRSRAQEPLHALPLLQAALWERGKKKAWHCDVNQEELTRCFGQFALSIAAAAGSAAAFCGAGAVWTRGDRNTLAKLSLLVQLLPVGPVCSDHVNHWLKFRSQLGQSLKRGIREQKIRK